MSQILARIPYSATKRSLFTVVSSAGQGPGDMRANLNQRRLYRPRRPAGFACSRSL